MHEVGPSLFLSSDSKQYKLFMQSYRTLSRLPVNSTKRALLRTPITSTRKMSLFPRAFVGSDSASFTPLFRLLDDFDTYSRGSTNGSQHHHRSHVTRTFNPKFDVKELADSYELHGELPGIEQKDVEIEFSDPQTLTVRGRTERTYTSGTPPAAALENTKTGGAITENGHNNDHHATVEDADEDADEDAAAKNTSTTVAAPDANANAQDAQPQEPQAKYWVSERSIGEFARSFSFPARVDQDLVKASMKNGILSIVVPKAKKHESRKITIS